MAQPNDKEGRLVCRLHEAATGIQAQYTLKQGAGLPQKWSARGTKAQNIQLPGNGCTAKTMLEETQSQALVNAISASVGYGPRDNVGHELPRLIYKRLRRRDLEERGRRLVFVGDTKGS